MLHFSETNSQHEGKLYILAPCNHLQVKIRLNIRISLTNKIDIWASAGRQVLLGCVTVKAATMQVKGALA